AVHDQTFGRSVLPSKGERRGWMGADRRELDEMLQAGPLGSLDKSRFPLDQALVDGREQQSPINAGQRGVQRVGGVEVAPDELGARSLKIAGSRGVLNHRPDRPTRVQQGPNDQAAVRPGRTGDEDHQTTLRERGTSPRNASPGLLEEGLRMSPFSGSD